MSSMNNTQRDASRARAKSDTISAMGLQAFLNDRYGADAYERYTHLITSGRSDAEIAKAFSSEHRRLHYQTVAGWRRNYVREAPDVKP